MLTASSTFFVVCQARSRVRPPSYRLAQRHVSDGFFRALLCSLHLRGIFGCGRCRDLDDDALSNDGACTGAPGLSMRRSGLISSPPSSRQRPHSPAAFLVQRHIRVRRVIASPLYVVSLILGSASAATISHARTHTRRRSKKDAGCGNLALIRQHRAAIFHPNPQGVAAC